MERSQANLENIKRVQLCVRWLLQGLDQPGIDITLLEQAIALEQVAQEFRERFANSAKIERSCTDRDLNEKN